MNPWGAGVGKLYYMPFTDAHGFSYFNMSAVEFYLMIYRVIGFMKYHNFDLIRFFSRIKGVISGK